MLLKPMRLMMAPCSGRRNRRGRGLPGCGRGVTGPSLRRRLLLPARLSVSENTFDVPNEERSLDLLGVEDPGPRHTICILDDLGSWKDVGEVPVELETFRIELGLLPVLPVSKAVFVIKSNEETIDARVDSCQMAEMIVPRELRPGSLWRRAVGAMAVK